MCVAAGGIRRVRHQQPGVENPFSEGRPDGSIATGGGRYEMSTPIILIVDDDSSHRAGDAAGRRCCSGGVGVCHG